MGLLTRIKGAIRGFKSPDNVLLGRDVLSLGIEQNIGRLQRKSSTSMLQSFESWVYGAVSCIASDIANAELILRNKENNEVITEHPFLELMKTVNPYMNYFDLLETTQIYLDLTGNAYWYLPKNRLNLPGEIWYLESNKVIIVPGKNEFIQGYIYITAGGKRIVFDEDEIIHFKYPNPQDRFYGMSPLEALYYAVNANESMHKYNYNVFKNSGLTGVGIKVQPMDEQSFRRLKNELRGEYGGLNNAGKIPVLEGVVDVLKFAPQPKDLAYLEGLNLTRDEILSLYGVPKTKLGIATEVNRASSYEMDRTYVLNTLQPRAKRIASKINEKLLPLYDEKLECELRVELPEDKEFILQERELDIKNGIRTINELRAERGLEPVSWGDVPLMPMNIMPIMSVGSSGKSILVNNEEIEKSKKTDIIWKRFVKIEEKIEKEYIKDLKEFFNIQKKMVLGNLRRLRETGIERIKEMKNIEDLILPSLKSESERLVEISKRGFDLMGRETIRLLAEILQGTYELNSNNEREYIKSFQDDLNAIGIDDIVYDSIMDKVIQDWKDTYSITINQTMFDDLKREIKEGINNGETINQIANRIEGVYSQYTQKIAPVRSLRIARTETVRIMNNVQLNCYKYLGVQTKIWSTALDEFVCEQCADLDGEEVPIDKDFSVGVSSPPLHPNSYSKDTEIYTKEGWKNVKDLKVGDYCLSLNPETFNLEYQKVIKTYEHKAEKMIHFYNRSTDLLVTEDHNMFYQSDWEMKHRPERWRFVKARELLNQNWGRMYRSSKWIGKKKKNIKIGELTIPFDIYCQFMGIYLSEGSISEKNGKLQLKISQSREKNPDKFEEIVEILSMLNVKLWIGKDAIFIPNQDICNYVKQFGKSYEKYIPEEIKESDPESIRLFLDAYLLGDGSIKKGKNWKGGNFRDIKVYFTSSKRMADDIGELILKIGRRPSFNLMKIEGKSQEFKNGIYTINHDVWRITECNSQYTGLTRLNKEIVDYNDYAYCVDIAKNHTLLTRRNGKVIWSGNCRCLLIMGGMGLT